MDSNIKSGVYKYYLNCVLRTDKHGKLLETKNGARSLFKCKVMA